MFPGIIPETFSMSSNKSSCLKSEAVGLYFNNTEDLKKSSSSFTICYNKATNKQMKKWLGIKIEFWSETDSAVKVYRLKTCLMGHATGVLLKNYYLKIMKYYYHHCRPLEVMVQMLVELFGINKMNKSHQKEKGKF